MKASLNTLKIAAASFVLALLSAGVFSQSRELAEEGQVKGPWADAEVGAYVKLKIFTDSGQSTRTMTVIRADERSVTLRISEGGRSVERQEQRMYSPQDLDKWMAGTKLEDKTITILGKDMKCEVYEKEVEIRNNKVKARAYFNRSVPGWVVRVENESAGQFKTVLEVADFKG